MLPHNMAIASMFGRPSKALQQTIQTIHAGLATTAIGQTQLFQNAVNKFQDMNFGQTAKVIDSMRSKHESTMNQEAIRVISTIGEFQEASYNMRRIVMATPSVRQEFQAGNICGYAGLYIDASPTGIAESHYDYRVFTNGVVMHEEQEDGTVKSTIRSYVEPRKEEYTIDIMQKRAAAIVMANANYLLNNSDYDLTSPDNDML